MAAKFKGRDACQLVRTLTGLVGCERFRRIKGLCPPNISAQDAGRNFPVLKGLENIPDKLARPLCFATQLAPGFLHIYMEL